MAEWQEKIEGANATWMKNYAEGNSAGVGCMYTEGCRVMPPGANVVTGRQGTSEVFAGAMKAGVKRILLKSDEVGPLDANDNTAFERGSYLFFKEDGSVADQGKYVVVWKQVNGDVFMDVDIWNSDNPK